MLFAISMLKRNFKHIFTAAQKRCKGHKRCICPTARSIYRSSIQQWYYSGYKRVHCVKFQSVIFLDGIIASFKGAFKECRKDAGESQEECTKICNKIRFTS